MRVLHSPINIAGGPGAISQGLRELGVESTLLVFNERPFEAADVNLELAIQPPGQRPLNLPKQLRTFAWAVPRPTCSTSTRVTLLPRKLNLRPCARPQDRPPVLGL